jgi:hypothetical protein
MNHSFELAYVKRICVMHRYADMITGEECGAVKALEDALDRLEQIRATMPER